MIDFIVQFLRNVGNLIGQAFDFLINTVKDIAGIVTNLGKLIIHIPQYLSWLPARFSALIAIMISAAVIYKVLGREG